VKTEDEVSVAEEEENKSAPGSPVTGNKDNVRRRPQKI